MSFSSFNPWYTATLLGHVDSTPSILLGNEGDRLGLVSRSGPFLLAKIPSNAYKWWTPALEMKFCSCCCLLHH